MTRDDIIKLAREAGGYTTNFNGRWMFYNADIERFAALIAAAEREACARVAEEYLDDPVLSGMGYATGCAAAIRARGDKK